ncbi:hypothetical protein LEADMMO150B3_09220 [Leclercia adecarboxylata]
MTRGLTFRADSATLMPILAVYKFVMRILFAFSFRSANEKEKHYIFTSPCKRNGYFNWMKDVK